MRIASVGRFRLIVTALLGLILALTACSGGGGAPVSDGSIRETVNGVAVTGLAGTLSGGSVEVVAGELPEAGSLGPIEGFTQAVSVEVPQGTTVNNPVTLTWRAPRNDGAVPVVIHTHADGSVDLLNPTWDGQVAAVEAREFSTFLLGWLRTDTLADWVKERAWTFLSGRRTQPACEGKVPDWVTVDTVADIVQVCVRQEGDTATVTVGSLRDFWVQLEVSGPVRDLTVPDQFMAFRQLLADSFGYDVNGTVLMPPGGVVTFQVKRPSREQSVALWAGATGPATFVNATYGAMAVFGVDSQTLESSSGLKLLAVCGRDYLKSYAEDKHVLEPDKLRDALYCTAREGLGNLSDPVKAERAVYDTYGQSMLQSDRTQQAKLLSETRPRFVKAGKLLDFLGQVDDARSAVMAGFGLLGDAVQELVTKGEAGEITLVLKGIARKPTLKYKCGRSWSEGSGDPLVGFTYSVSDPDRVGWKLTYSFTTKGWAPSDPLKVHKGTESGIGTKDSDVYTLNPDPFDDPSACKVTIAAAK